MKEELTELEKFERGLFILNGGWAAVIVGWIFIIGELIIGSFIVGYLFHLGWSLIK